MKIYIDINIPKHLFCKLEVIYKDNRVTSIDEADVVFKYAHDSNLQLSPLEDFNLNTNARKKTLFFSWYDWNSPKQRIFFTKYFTPQNPNLWNFALCRFTHIPSKTSTIKSITKELYNAK